MTSTERLAAALADRYRIEREVGAGGMATVYLAQDLKHDRKVAIKVLKPELAAVLGAERFVQEIKTTAALQHPHILPLYDSGSVAATPGGPTEFLYYVMPFIAGETLREKLDRGTQLGIDEAVRITSDVADALDYAHRHGVVHRDIKPENILLHDGRPMVADFGIALAVSAAAGGRMTETGLSLGTPHYMSPEQATAEKDLTNRSDIYSLGGVLYEMLTGEPPHLGTSAQQIIMRIVTEEAQPVTRLRRSVPPHVAAVVGKALEKLPADRFESTGEMRDALGNTRFRTDRQRASRSPTPLRAALVGGGVAIGLLLGWLLGSPGAESGARPTAAHLQLTLPPGIALPLDHDYPVLAISPDGTRLAFVGEREGRRQLYVRPFATAAASVLEGTDGALMPFFSPDGQWIGYLAGDMLYRVPVSGGASIAMLPTPGEGVHQGATWVQDSLLALVGDPNGGLMLRSDIGNDRIAIGFDEQLVTDPATPASWPHAVPGRADIVVATRDEQAGRTDVVLYASASGQTRTLVRGGGAPQVAAGHLLFARGATLFTVPYDATRGEAHGAEQRLLPGVAAGGLGVSHYAATDDVLAYVAGDTISSARELVWVERTGAVARTDAEPRRYSSPRIAPDGHRVTVTIGDGPGDVWLLDLDRNTLQPLTRDPGEDFGAVWSPDGRSIALSTEIGMAGGEAGPALGLMRELGGPVEQLTFSPAAGNWEFPTSWTPDGQAIVVTRRVSGRADVAILRLDSADLVPLVATPAEEVGARVSPDGRWLAYVSNASGRNEVWLRSFDRPGEAVQVSSDGGLEPAWSPDAGELFYRVADDLMAVSVGRGADGPAPGRPRRLFTGRFDYTLYGALEANYDVSPDGRRFLMVRRVQSVRPSVIQVAFDWKSVLLSTAGGTP